MHRVASARHLYQNSYHNISFPSRYSNTSILEIKCSICQRHLLGRPNPENIFLTRHQSTRIASAPKRLNKTSKHKVYKKYGELLEVSDKNMTETKVSISKLGAAQLSKLATSPLSLGQLHKLSKKCTKNSKIIQVDTDLLRSVKEKILKKVTSPTTITNIARFSSTQSDKQNCNKEIHLEDDKCALVFTNKVTNFDTFLNKQSMDTVKQSYYNFQKATLYDQRLQDLRYAIKEGLNQEFDLHSAGLPEENEEISHIPKGPHAVFKELFVENQMDGLDEELISHMSHLHSSGLAHPVIDDIIDDTGLDNARDYLDLDKNLIGSQNQAKIKSLKIKQVKAMKEKKKAKRDKRRATQELSMKQKMSDIERRGKLEALHALLTAHLQLLCSLQMMHEGRQVLQYYRQRASRVPLESRIKDVKVFNALLNGYASKGCYDNTKELLSFMEADKVDPIPQTFAAIFECIERSQLCDKVEALQEVHEKMIEKGISLNDILDKSKFLYDQREVVLKAIRRIDPHFEPSYTPPILDYNCPLLDDLKLTHKQNRMGLNISPAEGVVTLQELKENMKEQLENEIRGEIEIENINVQNKETETTKFYRQKLEETETEWRQVIKEAFIRNLGTLKSQSNASHTAITLYPYLKVLDTDQFVELIIAELNKLVDGSETYSPTLKLLQRDLGTAVYHKYQIEQYRKNGILDKIEKVYEHYCDWYINRNFEEPLNCRQAWQTLLYRHMDGPSLDIEETPWPMEMRQNVGKFLYNIIINDVKIDVNMFKPKAKVKKLPAVYKVHRPWARLVRLELKPHPALARLWSSAAPRTLRMRTTLVAARAPPLPWSAPDRGACLLSDVPLVRMPSQITSQWQQIRNAPRNQLYPALDSLNQLAEVPWKINKEILDLQLEVFRSGGDKKLDIPPPASSLDLSQFGDEKDASSAFKRRVAINRTRAEMHSLWCDALYKLSLANHYRDKVFWLPHNMDFRGRVYACPPHISQLGADAARALLAFARSKPLGDNGLTWLKLHAVNLTGAMKNNTVRERLDYADSILDKIIDSAEHPLDGQRWWTESEEPWQTLNTCMEINNAIKSGNPAEYQSGLPIHQDGSCNGLQHYAALGGDREGAAAVNLTPSDRPSDVYHSLANKIEKIRKRDAEAGVPAAIILENFVRRKVIKQTVMTTVYGVTKFGARLQIAKQLKDIDDFPKEHVWSCSQYLTAKTFESLREMFSSTKLIQDWFTDCAKVISVVCGESVSWQSPLGLPIVQPYYRRHPNSNAPLEARARPCSMKQRNAFPPNFIHSLDSSHMMLTGLQCQARGLAFVSVHDCYWTHAPDVPAMNKICREQFVALHSQPILKDLSDYLVEKYSYSSSEIEESTASAGNKRRVNMLLRKVPKKGNFDLSCVLDSVYFFS